MNASALRRFLLAYLVCLIPVAWISMRFDPYQIDGDAVSYMDIADLIRTHQWAGVVNAYWHPLYPSALLLGQLLFHPTRFTELDAYYKVNFFIFLLEVLAMLAFTGALGRLRRRMESGNLTRMDASLTEWLLSTDTIRLLGLALLVISAQRELSLGKVRPDALLQALLLFGFAAMLELCRAESLPRRLGFALLMGLGFGLAYLTKSFAFLLALLSIATTMVFQWRWMRRSIAQSFVPGVVALLSFAMLAGPWMGALSRQKHRLDFGDSGGLNYAWYVSGTEKFHLEPWQTSRFGSSDVHLIHPERQLLADPGIYSYKELPWGTIPPWFDSSFFNEHIVTHIHPGELAHRDLRNLALVLRYLFNHPESWLLLLLFLLLGARLRGNWKSSFWIPPVFLGASVWAIYGLVNIEERYVTVGYLVLLLPVFASLRIRPSSSKKQMLAPGMCLPDVSTAAVALLALLALGESIRIAFEFRREESLRSVEKGWYDPQIFGAAEGLQRMGVKPGDEIACIGSIACVYDPYWMRLAGVRTTTEIFMNHDHLAQSLAALPNREHAYQIVRNEGARVLVGHFDAGDLATSGASAGWQRLGTTAFFALPLNLPLSRKEAADSTHP